MKNLEVPIIVQSTVAVLLEAADVLSVNTKNHFQWSSGEKAPILVDLSKLKERPDRWDAVVKIMTTFIEGFERDGIFFDVLAAVGSGATEHTARISAYTGWPTINVTKGDKGDPESIGRIEAGNVEGLQALVVEDVASTGKNIARVAKVLLREGAIVTDAACFVSHLSNAHHERILQKNGITIHPLLSSPILVRHYHEVGKVSAEQLEYIERWLDSRVA